MARLRREGRRLERRQAFLKAALKIFARRAYAGDHSGDRPRAHIAQGTIYIRKE